MDNLKFHSAGSGRRFLFYSHDGLGLGHTRRHLAVAAALTEMVPAASVLLATGADYICRTELPPHVEVLKLPSLRKVASGSYISRKLLVSREEIGSLRSALLLAAVEAYEPEVILVDKHPFGVGSEFLAGLERARSVGARAVLGLRDILDEPGVVRREWGQEVWDRAGQLYDSVLVYGQPEVFDPVAQYGFPQLIAQRTHFCGYVVNREAGGASDDAVDLLGEGRPLVLATAGGGEDGFFHLQAFIQAAAMSPWRGMVVAGPMSSDQEIRILRGLAEENDVRFAAHVPSLAGLLGSVDALVCMGGYNTLAEAASRGVPTLCIPRLRPRREQLMRALAFERLGLLKLIRRESLSPEVLAGELEKLLRNSRRELLAAADGALSFDGAQRAANHLLGVALGEEGRELRGGRGFG